MATDQGRGRHARKPWQVPARGWKEILRRVWREVTGDNIDLVAAGVAFYWLLSVFPAIIAAVSIWGLFADPAEVAELVHTMGETMPREAQAVIGDQMLKVSGGERTALGVGTAIGIATALWGALKGTKALMEGLNIAYDEHEKRNFFSLNGQAFLLLMALLITGAVATVGVIVLPALFDSLGLGSIGRGLQVGRWPLLAVGIMLFLAAAYRYGPCRDNPQWTWASAGAALATILWLVGSALFSLYVGKFGSYNETYGSIAGVVVLLLWFWLTAYVILVGAEFNNELERQTIEDTTKGPPEPMGQRGAVAADFLPDDGPSRAR